MVVSSINSENIFPIIKRNGYILVDIFKRVNLNGGVDTITKQKT